MRHGADPAAMELLPGVTVALGALAAAGYRLVVAGNQSGVARGLFTVAEARAAARHLAAVLTASGVRLAGYYFCPHHPRGAVSRFAVECACRKPEPGLILRAAAEIGLDLPRSWMIGDASTDAAAGAAAGARSVVIDIGRPECVPCGCRPTALARSLPHAAALILATDGHLRAEVAPSEQRARRSSAADLRRTGEPCPWPEDGWLAVARRDESWLKSLLERSVARRAAAGAP